VWPELHKNREGVCFICNYVYIIGVLVGLWRLRIKSEPTNPGLPRKWLLKRCMCVHTRASVCSTYFILHGSLLTSHYLGIFICRVDTLKISDFGLATVFRHEGRERQLDTCCGTVPYLAPEVIQKKPYKAEPIDVWSIGIVLVALLAGGMHLIATS